MGQRGYIVVSVCLILGCVGPGPKSTGYTPGQAVKLRLVPSLYYEETTQYHSRAVNRIFQGGTLQKKSNDDLDFQVKTTITKVDPIERRIALRVESLSKSGDGDLREFAIPEIGERLELILSDRAEVIQAGEYPKDSIFYLPTISLPKGEVSIGDSWVLNSTWVTAQQNIPLKMEMVSILKKIEPCDKEHCALVEIDGEVTLKEPHPKELGLQSRIRGYLQFSLESGSVVWSFVQSNQTFTVGSIVNKYESCLVSYVTKPRRPNLAAKVSPYCDPEKPIEASVIP